MELKAISETELERFSKEEGRRLYMDPSIGAAFDTDAVVGFGDYILRLNSVVLGFCPAGEGGVVCYGFLQQIMHGSPLAIAAFTLEQEYPADMGIIPLNCCSGYRPDETRLRIGDLFGGETVIGFSRTNQSGIFAPVTLGIGGEYTRWHESRVYDSLMHARKWVF